MTQVFINPSVNDWTSIIKRPHFDSASLYQSVAKILNEIEIRGDEAVREYSRKFDNYDASSLKVTDFEIADALEFVQEDLRNAITIAKANIEKFHSTQIEKINKVETSSGVTCWRKPVPIDSVGLYIPGGTAPLFSTLLMLAIPAKLAGCRRIVVCTPPHSAGGIHNAILYVAHLLGLKQLFKIGGVQAIGAMAYGTKQIPRVDKIFGPGNQYVTCAKELVHAQGVSIDMPAGPSEVAVYADETCVPSFIASDLLSQAEHGADSQVMLVASQAAIIDQVQQEINKQKEILPRKGIIEKALENSRLVVMENVSNAFDLLNEYAPEHLIIASDNALQLSENVVNAGSVFLGHYSPESAGDYASGTNHTLPTNGYAKTYSGISVDSFVKKITFQMINKVGLNNIADAVETMAGAEGLEAHRKAIAIRREHSKESSDEL
jgi:histidinol dehydrogenase